MYKYKYFIFYLTQGRGGTGAVSSSAGSCAVILVIVSADLPLFGLWVKAGWNSVLFLFFFLIIFLPQLNRLKNKKNLTK